MITFEKEYCVVDCIRTKVQKVSHELTHFIPNHIIIINFIIIIIILWKLCWWLYIKRFEMAKTNEHISHTIKLW
jgi:hypothetical protein